MDTYLTQSQKIKVTCIVRQGNKILLIRRTEVSNPAHQPQAVYFGIPSFTVPFGEDPRTTLATVLQEYVGDIRIANMTLRDIRQYMSRNGTTQVFEVLFHVNTTGSTTLHTPAEKLLFVNERELDAYMFPQEAMYIRKHFS